MALFLRSSGSDFASRFGLLVNARRDQAPDVQSVVRDVINAVRERGDTAVIDYTKRFDGLELDPRGFAIDADELKAAYDGLSAAVRDALGLAHERITAHHRLQLPTNDRYRDAIGAELGHFWTALDSVGLYVPGGKASYPSSVLMNAIPAKVAGVPRLVMAMPAPGGQLNRAALAAAYLAGVSEVYPIGGAQAVAALAYGTEAVSPVAKIVGPGNAYVAEAKRQVFGVVGIDTIAGPSEVLVVADGAANPAWVAADLLAQAEHDEAAQAILLTDSAALAQTAASALEQQLATMPRKHIAAKSWGDHGAIILVSSLLDEAPALIDALAPEHLELSCGGAEEMIPLIRNAGAIFIGYHTPEAVGDYVGGSNHVLPTSRAARFSSGLGVLDFMKRTSLLKLDPASLAVLGPATMALAEAESLHGHGYSVAVRLQTKR